ncbi:tetratricopeptide repeat protein [Campylobacter coli]|uniref:tetratricopeptide repeat protein n=1 Tax=Campylobacter coli TaxID=195 RepID=UPI00092E2472|nr:tetratricopeptide repeat protein [Campylobacter coli]ECO5844828.1 tetratricopeptide repeat protein [Campylobacter coli]ECQ1211004.1 tetratricopeptide repeat protein [Campylobacter coli]ECQ5542167.1 tetratricopeptide repeat protein [Campylobacter coli]ECR2880327.1 tetratricopeptide repeat protein [Campylobacter coli]EDO7140382.1 tetratricopeptide repeat protein [Campylobacter coli]
MKKIFSVALIGATLLYAESSAFGAGDLTSNSPYGLTSSEKLLKEKLDTLSNNNVQANSRINEIEQRVEGLQSTLEGINSQYAKSNSRLTQLETRFEAMENNLSTELQNLKAYVEESRKIQDANNKQIKKILTELSSLVDSINANYVSKDDLNSTKLSIKNTVVVPLSIDDKNITSSDENNASVAPVQEKEVKQIDDSWKKKKNNEILDLAIKDLNNNSYENSKIKLNYLISKQYKPARANFWLGEIEYKQKKYNNAIAYYKKSSALSTKGDYFPKLLYHTAISLDKIGDPKTANGFYKALKTNYPNSPEAKASPNRK